MGKLFVMAALALAWLSAPVPEASAQARGRIDDIRIAAPSLQNNLVRTETEQNVAVYLPPSYRRASNRRYPVIYLLHGIFDSRMTWIEYVGAPAILDRLIAAGRIPELIVVMPDAGNVYGGGFYRNSPVTGNWRNYITGDLMREIDRRYRTLARPGGRAIAGWSMGGYGALHIAMERPGLYSAAYAISPCCLAPVEDLGFGNQSWSRAYSLRSSEELQGAIERREFYTVAALGVLAAFNPDPNAPPFHVDFPFDIEGGQLAFDAPAYNAYLAKFPVYRVAETRDALAGLRALGLDYGIDDQFPHIPIATTEFSQRLAELRIPHRFDVYDGDHRQRVAERLESVVLPYLAAALDPPE